MRRGGRGRGRGQARQNAPIAENGTLQTVFRIETAQDSSDAPVNNLPPARGRGRGRGTTSRGNMQPTQPSAEDSDVFTVSDNAVPGTNPNLFTGHQLDLEEGENIDITVSPTTSDPDEEPANIPQLQAPRPRPNHPQAVQSSTSSRSTASTGSGSSQDARDIWNFFPKDAVTRTCSFCELINQSNSDHRIKGYANKTSTSILRRHLFEYHLEQWVDSCDELNIPIHGAEAIGLAQEYRLKRDGMVPISNDGLLQESRVPFSKEAFLNALTDFIIADDVAISITKSPRLQNIFLLLREDLQDQDIPKRTKLRAHIMQRLVEHFSALKNEILQKCPGKISYTMDLWSDPNLTPYMAVTAHWIEATPLQPNDSVYKLLLRTELIAFHRVPGRHTGDHLAQAFMVITDRVGTTSKIGWITLDNASNNDTFVAALERLLRGRHINFDKIERRVRCFPHIVNLACKAVLSAFTKMDFAAEDADLYQPPSEHLADTASFLDALHRDPIASLRSAIRNIRSSSLRRQAFSETLKMLRFEDLQLIRDVDIRWSSTVLMISRALHLQIAVDAYLSQADSGLEDYQLSKAEWKALKTFEKILAIPHAYQQLLSAEKTPTLGNAIPAFQGLIDAWKKAKNEIPEAADIIQTGIDKLDVYEARLDLVPANILATLLNPRFKLRYFEKKLPELVDKARDTFRHALEPFYADAHQRMSSVVQNQTSNSSWASTLLGFDSPVKQTRERTLDDEIASYFLDSSAIGDVESAVGFWERNQTRWPTIFRLALDILPIQGSSVPCERVFSSGKMTTTPRRNKIHHSLMEALQILKFSIKGGHVLSFTAGTSKDEEMAALEADTSDPAPQSMPDFIQYLNTITTSAAESADDDDSMYEDD